MPRTFSFWLLFASTVAVGYFFFQVIRPFVVVIVVAAVLAVLVFPLYQWLTRKLRGHNRIAAFLTTLLTVSLVLIPISVTLMMAGNQIMELGREAVVWLESSPSDKVEESLKKVEEAGGSRNPVMRVYCSLPRHQRDEVQAAMVKLAQGASDQVYAKTQGLMSDMFTFGVGIAVMLLTMYYVLADSELFSREMHRMVPLRVREERQLNERFYAVCRGVVLGTVVAGAAQAGLTGAALAVLGLPNVWLLMVATMFCSFIPFLGAAAVYVPISLWLMYQGSFLAGAGLLAYGAGVVSTLDNLVRAHVVGHQARLHPLVALITALGALQLIGLWGIFIGPIVTAFLYALVNLVRERVAIEVEGQEHKPERYSAC